MKKLNSKKLILTVLLTGSASFLMPISSSATRDVQTTVQSNQNNFDAFSQFRPKPSSQAKLDYDYLDFVFEGTVFNLGISDRVRRVDNHLFHTSRQSVKMGHSSPYRLEGSRVYLQRLPGDFGDDVQSYRIYLQNLAHNLPIASLSRNEQLSFWLNLHNISVLELMSKSRRARYSTDKRFGPSKGPMHDVKFIEIGGQSLSLRDIREKIVYPNWDDPNVIYGFFLGDIGSPALQTSAFTAETVKVQLQRNAKEFVNSLRGYETFKGRAQVSELYVQTSSFYFPNFHTDLKAHFKANMRPGVFAEIDNVETFSIEPYEYRIGTVAGGKFAARPRVGVLSTFVPATGQILVTTEEVLANFGPYHALENDFVKKREKLRKQGLWEDDVFIEDIETKDDE